MYTIKRAAELTGVPVATLRAWERRYGVVTPQRTDSRYRLYDEQSLRTIALMRDLVAAGWSPRQAAEEVRHRAATNTSPGASPGASPNTSPNASTGAAPNTSPNASTGDPAEGDGGMPPGTPAFADLVDAAAKLDVARVSGLLDDHLSRGSFEAVVHRWLMPALHAIGDAWAEGRIGVAGEHLVAAAVQRRLAASYEASASNPHGARIIIGLPPGARHELGILAFATAARRAGLAVTYLGPDLPSEDWSRVVSRHDARCVVLSLPLAQDLAGLVSTMTAIERADPRTQIFVGGSFQHLAPAPARPLGHDIAAAAAHLAAQLQT